MKIYPRCPKGSQNYYYRPKCAEQNGNLFPYPWLLWYVPWT